MKVDIGSKFTQLPTMTHEDLQLQRALLTKPRYTLYALKDLLLTVCLVIVICTTAGYLYGKLQNHPAKNLTPNCGTCSIYKK